MTWLLFLVLPCVALAAPSVTTSTLYGVPRTHDSGEIIFEDNFDNFDLRMWKHEITMGGGGNWEFQVYWNNRTNSYVRDSTMFLKPTLTSDRFGEDFLYSGTLELWGGQEADYCTSNNWYGCSRTGSNPNILNPVASSRLRTEGRFSFKYGKVECRAQIPEGDWLWPAIWLLPQDQMFGGWPTSGEIDIMESRGNLNLMMNDVNIGAEQYGATLHYGVDYTMNGWPKAHFDKNTAPGNGWHQDFHVYEVEWTPDYFKFSVDGQEIGTTTIPDGGFWELGEFGASFPDTKNPWEGQEKSAPFNQEFYIILNNAVGGTGYFPDEAQNSPYPKPWTNQSPHAAYDFYSQKDNWHPTWKPEENNGESAALKIDWIRVTAI